ncbi:hypothetical protein RhiirC2_852987 [Rhizophagus irregularis]|uniref:Uncharacterized protein n=1 Tax=Rhizophagus irregularis TaxID=588596 RepID=A0A2N1MXC2_9GLOM|nr:hypothetical protein RhiirC2_852987 [Rhizophagus irregularis]
MYYFDGHVPGRVLSHNSLDMQLKVLFILNLSFLLVSLDMDIEIWQMVLSDFSYWDFWRFFGSLDVDLDGMNT